MTATTDTVELSQPVDELCPRCGRNSLHIVKQDGISAIFECNDQDCQFWYSEIHVRRDLRHRFKKHEWLTVLGKPITKKILIDYLADYSKDFGAPQTTEDIQHFLEVYNFLYGEPVSQLHHIRCVATLIEDGSLKQVLLYRGLP